ncbi:undecaprenyl-diphosphatase [Candidatus Kryptobacter tengchongensis]|uniref:Undecaprenyl-diphosphatase n=1 Tax=Kryptobacter tengchongensis TaxID=1643429 RepID=A0A656D3I1_KRYT1|nr:undecaprenyl-diphosphate phosphatase [Candidatus Kryptobacter tengchongensis]CUS97237.1 undecaprenyl-diphosphatase [Candidatus Kryptobacter tengchongensis]CUS98127.1 undecaprenyl-diphosphatase [Candidatus Kryptobacter tengchongensis]CUU09745.1 undecaprenyl-diphosphatase [Candidatus Kryptobacter tengchongensis]CUU10022.1 undecaprenyl-diphosphatase [Candidatus Kryptobacter tengchongensis]
MNYLESLILAVLQGLTEFLPISSSGHLVLAEHIFGVRKTGIDFEVFVHFGTMLSVLVIFWKDIAGILTSFFSKIFQINKFKVNFQSDENFKTAILILWASIPAGVIGLLFEKKIEMIFQNPRLTALFLTITGLILFSTRFAKNNPDKDFNFVSSFFVGIAQAFAILPGISRSGATISAGMFSGINGVKSAKFSFLLSLPAILGATILKVKEILEFSLLEKIPILIFSTIISFITGYIAIKFLFKVISRGNFSLFAYYCLIIGFLGLIFLK